MRKRYCALIVTLAVICLLPVYAIAALDSESKYPAYVDQTIDNCTGDATTQCFDADDGEVITSDHQDAKADAIIKLESKVGKCDQAVVGTCDGDSDDTPSVNEVLAGTDTNETEWVVFSGDATAAVSGTNLVITVVDDQHAHVYSNIDQTTSTNWFGLVSDPTGTGAWVFGTNPTLTGVVIAGDITITGGAYDVDLIDDNASALSFDAAGKSGIINIVTTNTAEGVTMSGTLGVTGVLTASGGVSGNLTGNVNGDVTGNLTGTAGTATHVTITDNESTNENNPLVFVEDADQDGGTLGLESDGTAYYNPSTGKITATEFAGNLTGSVTGNCSGTAGVATAVTITDNESDAETNAVVFTPNGDLDGGNLGLESDGTFNYNPSTGTVAATTFSGNFTGNVTGTASDLGCTTCVATGEIANNAVDGTKIQIGTPEQGDVFYYDGTDVVALAHGTSGQFLKTQGNAANPMWDTPTGAGDISDVFSCGSGDCSSISMADGDLLNASAVNCSSTTEGIILPQAASCASATAEGQICWDTDDALYIGSGSAAVSIGGGAPADASYVLIANNATLSADRALVGGTGLSLTDGGSNSNVTLAFDSTELTTLTWSNNASATAAWTFNLSGTDPVLTAESGGLEVTGAINATGAITEGDVAIPNVGESAAISGTWEIQDDVPLDFGNGADWNLKYDETINDQLVLTTTGTSAGGAGGQNDEDAMFSLVVNDENGTLNDGQEVFEILNYTTELVSVDENGNLAVSGTSITTGSSDNPYIYMNETDGTYDWYLKVDDTANTFEISNVQDVTGTALLSITENTGDTIVYGDLTVTGSDIKIANTAGDLLVGDGTNFNAHTVTGDVFINSTGVTEIQNNSVDGTDIQIGTPAVGDVFYYNAGGDITNLGIGSTGQVLKVVAGIPGWGTDNDTGGSTSWHNLGDPSQSTIIDFANADYNTLFTTIQDSTTPFWRIKDTDESLTNSTALLSLQHDSAVGTDNAVYLTAKIDENGTPGTDFKLDADGFDLGVTTYKDTTRAGTSGLLDAYIAGTLEVDGAVNFDGAVDIAGALTGPTSITTGASADPSLTLIDSTDATGTGTVTFASANVRDVKATFQVDEDGTARDYMVIDGVNDKVIIGQETPDNETAGNVAFSIQGDADSDAADVTETLTIALTPAASETNSLWEFTDLQGAGFTFDNEVTFKNNSSAATFGAVGTDADVIVAFDAVGNQGSITYMNTEDRFDFDNDVDVVGDLSAATIAVDAANNAYLQLNEDTGTDWYVGLDGGDGSSIEIRANASVDTDVAFEANYAAGDITTIVIGEAAADSVTVTTDSTGTAEVALPAGSIDGTEILDDTVDSADYAAGSIDAEHLAADIVDFTAMADSMTLDANTSITTGAYTMTMTCATPGSGCYDFNGSGAYTGDLLHVHQHTGNAGAGNLIHAEANDLDITPLVHVTLAPADLTSDVIGLQIGANDDNDTNYIPLKIVDDEDDGVAPDTLFLIDSTGAVTTGIWNAGAVTSSGTIAGATLTEGGNAVPNVTDNLSVFAATSSAQLYGVLSNETGSGTGTPVAVFNENPTLTGATLAGILADNDDMVFECDANSDGSNKYSFTDGAATEIAAITEAGALQTDSNITIGANAATDYILTFDATTTDGTITYDQDPGEFQFNEDVDIASGKVYKINDAQINIGNLAAGGDWTPTGTVNLGSTTDTVFKADTVDASNISTIVESIVWVEGGLVADGTNCANPAKATINSGPVMYTILCADNDGSTIYGHAVMPDSWNAGTVTFELEYIQTAADTNVLNSDVACQCYGATETVGSTWNEQAIDDAAVSGSNKVDTTTSAAVTCAGTCAAGDSLYWRWQMDATGTTTAVATLHITGMKMEYTSNVGD